VARVPGISEVALDGRQVRARAENGAAAVPALIAAFEQRGVTVTSATLSRPSLDDVYLRHAGRAFHEANEKEVAA
jgi:ABC-2 type transport system ATP-binding protein